MSTSKKVEKKKKTKKRRRQTPFFRFLCFLLIGASVFLLYKVVQEVYTTISLRQQLAEVQAKYQEVQDENSYLTSEQEKLQDPEYVQSYARGNYMLTKDGEQVFYLPEDENK